MARAFSSANEGLFRTADFRLTSNGLPAKCSSLVPSYHFAGIISVVHDDVNTFLPHLYPAFTDSADHLIGRTPSPHTLLYARIASLCSGLSSRIVGRYPMSHALIGEG
ncbi:hypothetical protein M413DRAFT_197994 [Hebeloma cylindrosporum]|uniref:Uncharacterized protein n=1 Tax=Hebeloma cylindrosporum TaxID=76867 RepID=A0A0C3C522_HEBCY|nr:hypothetical protein M413DRAFT_197994 [Hebeloma cylindrosporum h7]